MKTRDLVGGWLQSFSKDMGISQLAFDNNGVCAIRYGDDVECVLECPTEAEIVYFYSPMGEVEAFGDGVLRELLKANLFCLETHGATFALDTNGSKIVLCYPQPTPLLDETAFRNILVNFLEISAIWYERLHKPEAFNPSSIEVVNNSKDEKQWIDPSVKRRI